MLLEHLCTSSTVAAGQRCEQGGAKHKRRYQLKPATWLLQFAVLVCTMTMAEAKPWPSQTANSMLNTSEVKVTEAFLHHPETQDRWVNLTAIPNDSSAYTNCSGQCGPPHLPLEHLVPRFLDTCDEMQNHVRFYVLILTGIFLISCAATSFLATAGHKRRRDRRRLHRKHHPQQQQQQRRRCISPAKNCASTRRKSARGTSQRHRSRQQRQRRTLLQNNCDLANVAQGTCQTNHDLPQRNSAKAVQHLQPFDTNQTFAPHIPNIPTVGKEKPEEQQPPKRKDKAQQPRKQSRSLRPLRL